MRIRMNITFLERSMGVFVWWRFFFDFNHTTRRPDPEDNLERFRIEAAPPNQVGIT